MHHTAGRWAQQTALAMLAALIGLSLAWEWFLAPLRPGGSWLALKALPLCLPLSGVAKGRVYTFQWSCMLVLAYIAEAVMRLFDATLASRCCAATALLLSTGYFIACLCFVRVRKAAAANLQKPAVESK